MQAAARTVAAVPPLSYARMMIRSQRRFDASAELLRIRREAAANGPWQVDGRAVPGAVPGMAPGARAGALSAGARTSAGR